MFSDRDAKNMAPFALLVACAAVLRLVLSLTLTTSISNRIELSTRASSFIDVKEAVFSINHGIDPYEGDTFHQAPLILALFRSLSILPDYVTALFLIALDIVAALQLRRICAQYHNSFSKKDQADLTLSPDAVAILYLFSPFTILSCVARSTSLLTNLAVLISCNFAMKGHNIAAAAAVSVATYFSFYPVMLLLPIIAFSYHQNKSMFSSILSVSAMASFSIVLLLYLSYFYTGSWKFLDSTYFFLLSVPDLTPNVGLFWYFFIEIFDHFRTFFLYVFQIHVFVYAIPLVLRFWHEPLIVIVALCGICALFKPYPTVADSALFLGLVPIFSHLFRYMRYSFIAGNLLIYTFFLGPAFFHLWIFEGSGNVNFFYAVTLLYGFAHILIVVDVLYSYLRREYDIHHPEHHGVQVVMR